MADLFAKVSEDMALTIFKAVTKQSWAELSWVTSQLTIGQSFCPSWPRAPL